MLNALTVRYNMQDINFFGHPRYNPLVVFEDQFEQVRGQILRDLASALGPDSVELLNFVATAGKAYQVKMAAGEPALSVMQQAEHELAAACKNWPVRQEQLTERCNRIASQISAALTLNGIEPRGIMLDLGAGSGGVAKMIKDSLGLHAAYLTDVVDYRFDEVKTDEQMHWALFAPPYNQLPFGELFDLAIVTNVLHHCDNPETIFGSLRDRIRAGGTVMVIESCVTVSESDLTSYPDSDRIPYQSLFNEKGAMLPVNADYFKLTPEETIVYATFCDWFYNKVVVAENIPVPFNFTHPERWNKLFADNGFNVKATYLMGFDQPIALEFHTLHLLTPSAD